MSKKKFFLKIVYILLLCPHFVFTQELSLDDFNLIINSDLKLFEKTKKIENLFEKNKNQDPKLLAELFYQYSKWNWSFSEDEVKSKLYAKKEYEVRKKIKIDSLKPLLLRNLYNLGYLHHHATIPDYTSALAYFDTLIMQTNGNDTRLGNVYREKGDIYDAIGDFQRALDNYRYSESIFKELKRQDLQLKTLINISGTYVSMGDSTKLNDFLNNKKVIESFKGVTISENQKAMVLLNTAAMYNTTSIFNLANKPLNTALFLFQKNKDTINLYKCLTLLGVLNKKRGDFTQSQEIFKSTLLYTKNNPLLKSATYNNLGDLLKENDLWEESFKFYHKALQEIVFGENTPKTPSIITFNDISISPYKKIIFGYLTDLINAYLEMWRLTNNKNALIDAEKWISLTDQVADDLFLESKEEVSKLSWRQKASDCYLNGVAIYFELGKPEKVFYYMEKNKGILLLENILEATARQKAGIPSYLIEKEFALMTNIQKLQLKILEIKDNTKEKDSLFNLKNKFRKFIDSLEQIFPLYSAHKNQLSIVPLVKAQEKLTERDLIIEYAISKNEVYALMITKKEVKIKKLKNDSFFLINQVNQLTPFLVKPIETKDQFETFQSKSLELFEYLFPISNAQVFLKNKRIIIIPDGILHSLPFEVLTISKDLPLPEAYLISFGEILYKYSLSVDSEMLNLKTNLNNNWAAFIPIKYLSNYKEPLLYNQHEEIFLIPYFKNRVYQLEKATKESFLKSYEENTVIHVSTHGGINEEGPWLALYDKPLYLNDLYFFNKPKEMVVLSACKTLQGEIISGEGVFSIARGFINSGTKAVVSGLWNLNEKSSANIISEYYKNLKKGERKSEALRKSKLLYLASHANTSDASPYYWAAIIIMGSDNNLSSKFNLELFIIPFLIIFIIGGYYFIMKKKFPKYFLRK